VNGFKFTILIILASLVLLVSGILLAIRINPGVSIQASSQVKASTPSTQYDWGTINLNDGLVDTSFTLKNDGSEELKLYGITTSCTCTTVQIKSKTTSSPVFSMHSRPGYVFTVLPDETVELLVVFDPAFHGPAGTGLAERSVRILTNDAANPILDFLTVANVVN
jgi:hypothetical protein